MLESLFFPFDLEHYFYAGPLRNLTPQQTQYGRKKTTIERNKK